MTLRRTTIIRLAIVVASFAVAATLYHQLPDTMPSHWGITGKVDGTMHKPWGVFLYPFIIACAALLSFVLPALSPKGFEIERFARVFDLIMTTLIVFLAGVMALAFSVALGLPVPMNRILLSGVGVFLIVIGNVMGKVTRNFYVGIRTPWTLANEEVWVRTHRLGGRLFVAGGLAIVIMGALGLDLGVPLIVIAVATVLTPIAYSYLLYRKLEGRSEPAEER